MTRKRPKNPLQLSLLCVEEAAQCYGIGACTRSVVEAAENTAIRCGATDQQRDVAMERGFDRAQRVVREAIAAFTRRRGGK